MSAEYRLLPDRLLKRSATRLREASSRWRVGHEPRQIIFMHVPKSAGTSMGAYLRHCVGSKRSGRTVVLRGEYDPDAPADPARLERARRARLCMGHFSWATLERIRREGAYLFTILRDPTERLWSQYNYLTRRTYPDSLIPKNQHDLYDRTLGMSPREFFTFEDPRHRHAIDNGLTRQIGGGMDPLPLDADRMRDLVGAAKRNLRKMNHVGFTDTFDDDFRSILKRLDLPRPRQVPHDKKSNPSLSGRKSKAEAFERFKAETGDLLKPLVRYDDQVYRFARAEFHRPAAPPPRTAGAAVAAASPTGGQS